MEQNKTHWKKLINPKYSGAYEFKPGEEKVVTIKKISSEVVLGTGGKSAICIVAQFDNEPKPYIINKKNAKVIQRLYGPYYEGWIGKSIILTTSEGDSFGEKDILMKVKNQIPNNAPCVNYTKQINAIKSCKTMEELKSTFTSLTNLEQVACLKVKDEMKSLFLSGGAK